MICSDFFCSFAKNVVSLPAIELLNNKSELNQVLSNNIIKHYGHIALVIVLFISVSQVSAQSILHRADSILAQRYLKGDIDTAYVVRPSTKWTFKGWHDHEGMDRITLPDGVLSVKTLNVNAFYVFNSRRFSYPAAFSQSYIQRRSAGSFLLAASGMGQRGSLDWDRDPTFIVYSNASMTFGDDKVPLNYHFPEVIITGRGAVVHQWSNKFLGLSMVFNFTNIGDKDNLSIQNIKWRIRTFFGVRF